MTKLEALPSGSYRIRYICDLIDAAEAGKFTMIGVTTMSLAEAVDRIADALNAHG